MSPAAPSVEFRPEDQGVDVIVIDAAVDHVHPLRPLGGAHVDDVVLDRQVAAFDQLHAQLVGQEGMFVIGRIILAGREHDDVGLARAGGRRDRTQRSQQRVGIILDRQDEMVGEEIGREPDHHFAIFEHVGDAGGRAHIVFQHVEIVIVDPDDVDPGDMGPDVMRDGVALHFRAVARIAQNEVARDNSRAENGLFAIDVGQEHVQGLDPLDQARLESSPFVAAEQARHDVEGNQTLRRLLVAIDRESDADAAKQHFSLLATRIEQSGRRFLEPCSDTLVEGARRPAVVVISSKQGKVIGSVAFFFSSWLRLSHEFHLAV